MAAVAGLGSSGLLSPWWSLFAYDAGQSFAALAATLACWMTAAQHSGAQRWWRLWMGAATCAWMVGQLFWSRYELARDVGPPSPSLADAGYLILPVFAIAAIIALATDRPGQGALRRPARLLVMGLDGLIVVGAVFVLTWATTLRSVVRARAATPLAYTVAIAYPVIDLLLTVIVILLIATGSSAANQMQLIILGAGLFCVSASDSVFAYVVSGGARSIPPLATVGYVAGLALVAVAALTPTQEAARPHARWGHLLLPYVPVAGMGVLFIVQRVRGTPLDNVEILMATAVVALLIIRQSLTLMQVAGLVASRARLVLVADQTRRQLERDLHDGVQQRLISLGLEIRRVEANVPSELTQLRQELAAVAAELSGTVDEVRELSRGVHPAILSEGGLRPALRTLARRCAVPVELDMQVDGRQPEPVEVAAYYVVAEALTNVTKYAQATLVRVGVRIQRGRLCLTVRDNGVGGADPKRGTGLTGLTDRVEALGGTLTLDSATGRGTCLQAEFPLNQP
ncbi:sensor histidine kinase [Dactylosporangium aurantiacum]|uniref:histidine kinase n=1 Tax=Dactylosporangium aurantiacum TaxID=35754 RepID=A0A9Q9IP16_9ACTN|nr:sensor histidine kinase [Dactylosporangium aurantiacum]MDG6108276.1 sensor histidine kinase [Dactylosporangium aurantiacum]UWZ58533.1 sensor histidine kinase [Dactylosporangium aurantiacum]